MDWSERINAAVDYIERNLTDEIDLSKAAEKAACSLFYFHRMFSAVTGLTPGDYIRRRRLTLAAADLTGRNSKVIDIALKYGYDSPNAFTRAFRRLHGLNPREASKPGVKLSTCPRILCHIEPTGGNTMDYRIVEKPAFDLVGTGAEFGIANGEFGDKGRNFWRKYVTTPEYKSLAVLAHGRYGMVSEAPALTAYLPNEKGTWDPIVNAFGIEKTDDMDVTGYDIFHIPAATYAEFHCTLKTSASTNKRIYAEWFPATGYERDEKSDIAAFFQTPWCAEIFVRWWIPVVKK